MKCPNCGEGDKGFICADCQRFLESVSKPERPNVAPNDTSAERVAKNEKLRHERPSERCEHCYVVHPQVKPSESAEAARDAWVANIHSEDMKNPHKLAARAWDAAIRWVKENGK